VTHRKVGPDCAVDVNVFKGFSTHMTNELL